MQRSRIRLDGDDVVDDRVDLAGCALVSVSLPRDDSQRFPGLRPTDGRLDVQDSEFVWLLVTTAAVNPGASRGAAKVSWKAHRATSTRRSTQASRTPEVSRLDAATRSRTAPAPRTSSPAFARTRRWSAGPLRR